jgi:CBS domain-containing protein
MLVRHLMQREVATLDVTDRLDLADDIMRLGRIRHLPVVDGTRLVGIVSQRDLFRAATSSLLQLRREAERDWLGHMTVAAVMSRPVYSVAPHITLRTAVRIMCEHRIGCLPVVEDDRLVGLLAESDCLRHLEHLLELAEEKEALPELPGE